MRWTALLFFVTSSLAWGHEIQSITQHVDIHSRNETGWQQDLIAKFDLNRKLDIGIQGTYLERFDLYEKRAGGLIVYRPSDEWTLEAKYLQGLRNDILPEEQVNLSAYYVAGEGLAPYLIYNDSRYSVTHLHTATAGIEIEKIQNFILIPQILFGKATFKKPSETKDVHAVGLKAIFYRESLYSITAYGYTGKEAAQNVVGKSNQRVDTLTGGLGAGYFFTPRLEAKLSIDHTDYDQLKIQFVTTTLNLNWKF